MSPTGGPGAANWVHHAWRRAVTVAAVLLPVVVSASSCDTSQPPVATRSPAVSVSESRLMLDGQQWWPTGLNAYQLATDWTVNDGCGAEVDPDVYFSALPDGSLTRFNAFQNLAVNRHSGEIDFTALDRVFAAAERHGQMILPVLAGQDGACDDEVFKQRDWYLGGWSERGTLPLSHRDWVETAVRRWAGSPVIAAWEPVGEPEPSVCPDGDCRLEVRACPADSAEVLRDWTDEVGALIRELDPGTLITAGVIGGDQCGIEGPGFGLLAESPFVDVIQYHDYDDAGFLQQRLAEVRIPVLVAEVGMEAGGCLPLAARADALAARFEHYREVGAAGALLWAFVPDPRPGECTFDVGADDPALSHPALQPGWPQPR